jgi:small subunit ribosomal protein S8
MSMTDPIADMLTRIRNAQKSRKVSVTLPGSKLKLAIAQVLEQEGYVQGVETDSEGAKNSITLALKYHKDNPVIERIERVSRPGLRVYASAQELPQVQGRQARAQGRGGEVLCIVS